MLGAEMTTLSRMIANGLPTFSWVTRAKRLAAGAVEADRDRRPAVLLVEVLLGVGDLVAGDDRAALDRDARAAAFGIRQDLAADRRAAGLAAARASTFESTSLNSSRAVRPISAFSASGSCRPGTWTRIRLLPWRMMVGSSVPSGVDAAVDDLARDLHRLVDRLRRGRPGSGA